MVKEAAVTRKGTIRPLSSSGVWGPALPGKFEILLISSILGIKKSAVYNNVY